MIFTRTTSISTYLLVSILLCTFLSSACSEDGTQQKLKPSEPSVIASDIKPQHKQNSISPTAPEGEKTAESKFIQLARSITVDYQLTTLPLECLEFELLDELIEGKRTIDVRERHSKNCGGDPKTSVRIYSIAIDEATGRIWSDARSLLGQMEVLETIEKTSN
jgi:hypothetical protein